VERQRGPGKSQRDQGDMYSTEWNLTKYDVWKDTYSTLCESRTT